MINSRDKGARFEREVAGILRENGWPDAERGQQHAGGPESPDVRHGPPGLHLECKHVESFNLWDAMEQAMRDAAKGVTPVVVYRKNGRKPVAILDFVAFLQMYRKAYYGESPDPCHPLQKWLD